MKLERYEQISSLIKTMNDKKEQYILVKDNENIAFINELRNELLDVITSITDTYIAKTTSANTEEEKFRLVAEQALCDNTYNCVFVQVDLETGEISLLNACGHTQTMRIINGKEVKSTYQIEDLVPTEAIIRKVDGLNSSKDNLHLKLLDYVRNNPDIFNEEKRTR